MSLFLLVESYFVFSCGTCCVIPFTFYQHSALVLTWKNTNEFISVTTDGLKRKYRMNNTHRSTAVMAKKHSVITYSILSYYLPENTYFRQKVKLGVFHLFFAYEHLHRVKREERIGKSHLLTIRRIKAKSNSRENELRE